MSAQEKPAPLAEVERLAETYAKQRAHLADQVAKLEAELAEAKRRAMPTLRSEVAGVLVCQDELRQAIEAAEEYFERPKTRVFAGVRVGFKKTKPKVVIADEEAVIRRIRERLPADQAELLIRTTESVHKPAVYDLSAADLRRLGIGLDGGEDVVVIKAQDSEVSKVVDALLGTADIEAAL